MTKIKYNVVITNGTWSRRASPEGAYTLAQARRIARQRNDAAATDQPSPMRNLSIRLPDSMIADLQDQADAEHVNVNVLIREAIYAAQRARDKK